MGQLRDRVADVAALIPRSRPVVYLDYPVHTNIGDLLIERGTETFFEHLGYDLVAQRSAHDFGPRERRRVPRDATIVLHGGGNFGDLYGLHQPFREAVIAAFPDHRIVLLPQTLHFESTARLEAAAALFARHADLHVCLRDTVSLETYSRYFVNPVYLVPDMAHFLWNTADVPDATPGGRGTLLVARRDRESQGLAGLAGHGMRACDWPDIVAETLVFRVLRKINVEHARLGGRLPVSRAWRAFIRRLVGQAFDAFGAYDAVVTNRLHAAIFGLLLGKPVTMSDNSYGKLSSYYNTWLRDVPGARLSGAERAAPREAAMAVLAAGR